MPWRFDALSVLMLSIPEPRQGWRIANQSVRQAERCNNLGLIDVGIVRGM